MDAQILRTDLPITEAVVQLTVPFCDLDPMQIVWHGNYLKYFDMARQALFDRAGLEMYVYQRDSGYLFPIVRTRVKHVHPLRHRDRFTCRARVLEVRTLLVLAFEVRLLENNRLCARGRGEQAAVRAEDLTLEPTMPAHVKRAFGLE